MQFLKKEEEKKWRQQPCSWNPWKPASWPITCWLKHQACLLAHRSLSSWSTHGVCHLAHQNLWPGLTVKGFPFQGQSAKTRIGDYFFKCASINKRIQRSIELGKHDSTKRANYIKHQRNIIELPEKQKTNNSLKEVQSSIR